MLNIVFSYTSVEILTFAVKITYLNENIRLRLRLRLPVSYEMSFWNYCSSDSTGYCSHDVGLNYGVSYSFVRSAATTKLGLKDVVCRMFAVRCFDYFCSASDMFRSGRRLCPGQPGLELLHLLLALRQRRRRFASLAVS